MSLMSSQDEQDVFSECSTVFNCAVSAASQPSDADTTDKNWIEPVDRGCNTIYRYNGIISRPRKNAPNKMRVFKRKVPVIVHTTNSTPGSRIRDAVTGMTYRDMRVGTRDENLFFKVALATGELNKYSNHLYFGSPGEYDAHMHCLCSDETRNRWRNKYMKELRWRDNKE